MTAAGLSAGRARAASTCTRPDTVHASRMGRASAARLRRGGAPPTARSPQPTSCAAHASTTTWPGSWPLPQLDSGNPVRETWCTFEYRIPTKVILHVPEPLQRADRRLVNEVHEQLREMIASGEVAPDTRLYQERLAASMAVSRTPLREALLRLEREGLVYTVPGRGMFVRNFTPEQAADLYQLRVVLEPLAARLACEQATDEQLAKVTAIQGRHEHDYPVDVVEAFRGNFDLHTSLVAPCPNHRLCDILRDIWGQNSALLIFGYYTHNVGAVGTMVTEHRAIVDAFALRDGVAVERLLRQHIQDASESLIRRLHQSDGTGGGR